MADPSLHPLAPLGWDARVSALFESLIAEHRRDDERDLTAGRVVRVERSACVVATAGGDRTVAVSTLPAVGDWVALADDAGDLSVVAVAPRWSELARRDPERERVQVLAANVDLVFVTVPGDRPSLARAERESVLAWESGARPVIVVTKADVAPADLVEQLESRLVGTDVVSTSGVTGEGVDVIARMLAPCRTAVLLGPSGAGKSTLANALLGEERFATTDVRASDARGRHTTTNRELVVVPGGGVLVDTPGLRSLGLLGDEGIAAAFADVEALAAGCRFRDCAHDREPGCAVLAAVDDGSLRPERVESYRKLRLDAGSREARRANPRGRPPPT